MWSGIEFIYSDPLSEQDVTAMQFARKLHIQEQIIYQQTREFVDKNHTFVSMDYLFYDFQILCEFIERFYNELTISYEDKSLNNTLDILWLAIRFLQIGHYDAVGMYIRKAFESWVSCFYNGKVTNNFKEKIKWLTNNKKEDWWPLYLDSEEIYKIYKYLSNQYTHQIITNGDIAFDKKKYLQLHWLFTITLIVMSYLIVNMTQESVLLKYRKNDIKKPVGNYKFYAAYIWPLVGSGLVSWSQYWFENVLPYTWLQLYDFWNKKTEDIWLNLDIWLRKFE